MTTSFFPNVPIAPGVPAVPRQAGQIIDDFVSLEMPAALSDLWGSQSTAPTWGVYDSSGNQVVTPDSLLDFGLVKDTNIPNFPVQDGSFANYNKVVLPYTVRLRLSKGGTQDDRQQFLQQIDTLWNSIDLYTVITPEVTYTDLNLEHYEVQRRGAGGAFFLTEVELMFIQIIQVSQQYSNTTAPDTADAQNPSAQGTTNVGSVQPQTPDSQSSSAANAGLADMYGYG